MSQLKVYTSVTDTSSPVIRVENLSKTYQTVQAVKDLSFEVPSGIISGFIGPNGAGKSTTLRMLLGLVRPTAGTGWVLGQPITKARAYLSQVGALIEGPAFYPSLSGQANLLLLAKLGRFDRQQVERVLEFVGLSDRRHDRVKNYSLGMKQRLGIAAALLPDPKLLILDEPTNGLDPEGIAETRTLLHELKERGISIFVSSHLLSEIELVCEYVVLLKQGRKLFAGWLSELTRQARPQLRLRPEHVADLAALLKLVESLGFSGMATSELVVVEARIAEAAALNRAAMAAGITLSELMAVRPNLEKTFFDLTQSETAVLTGAIAAPF